MQTQTQNRANSSVDPDQRFAKSYYFNDKMMDLFFMSALSWGPAGGLDIGQAYYVASGITDGDADSWVKAFSHYGDLQKLQAQTWQQRGWQRAAGETWMKAFASYRSAWQFSQPGGHQFKSLYQNHKACFAAALRLLNIPASFFDVPWMGKSLPGLFLQNEQQDAPVVLVVGGADTCFEDLYLSLGKGIFERGFSVAIVDLPGQGAMACEGLYWEVETERPIAAIIDSLIAQNWAQAGNIALLGISLGGYFATRAAAYESRLAAVIASSPLPQPGKLFRLSVESDRAKAATIPQSSATARNREFMGWKAGATSAEALLERWDNVCTDAARVTVPFLSILGSGDSPVFTSQGRDWHEKIHSIHKELVVLDETTGADGHCQVNARIRLVQESCGWLDEIFQR